MNAISRHWQVAREALVKDRKRSRNATPSADPRFLPAALEVVERPVSPTGRFTAWVLLVGLAATFIWLVFGRVDVVASAQGKIMPADDVKLVQASDTGVVRHIYVRDGDVVKKGQPLIDLDPTVSAAEQIQAEKALLASQLDVARNQAIANALSGRGLHFDPPPGTPADVVDTQRRLIAAQFAQSEAGIAGMAAARTSSLADARAATEQIKTLDQTAPVLERELDAMHGLEAKGYAPGLKLLEMERQKHSEAGQREIAVAQRSKALSDARKYAEQLKQMREQARQTALSDLAKAQSEAMLRQEELTKAQQKSHLQRLVAPVDGTVQQLAVHTVGGVVEAIRPLMVVVPYGALTMQAKVLNRDAGFVSPGQNVAVKLEAFPFTRYGTIPGKIESISTDAVEDKKLGPVYVARITLLNSKIDRGDEVVSLGPGMSATADIRTGQRSIISYLISPIDKARREAAREQ
ncbi:HlyD family type I secretion periplasmic adaptor subunit [Altericroceibacterium endophyticum]|uniref:Membrane fusion protein (MFP) family protein n=1 Tax=Altericroceibacterium endophyticum TaxID=1808508 RepID=A0A6I4T7J5_9SPHN|nr:HlyD family type I secretion periplasmic adaptor subunit [Altericroceibacterium endophyticum]MXO65953.1 HlyD family type I secretion periplasmic adaptor subunit [Altericroceibacterium endophyticum]